MSLKTDRIDTLERRGFKRIPFKQFGPKLFFFAEKETVHVGRVIFCGSCVVRSPKRYLF